MCTLITRKRQHMFEVRDVGLLGTQLAHVLCDQEKYILHCMHENSFVSESQTVT